MAKVIPFLGPRRGHREIREQAAAWLARIDAGASGDDLERLQAWLAEDKRHLQAFLNMATLWDDLTILSQLSEIFPLEEYAPRPRRLRPRSYVLAAACSLVLAVSGVLLWSGAGRQEEETLHRTFTTGVGMQTREDLPDGSSFVLNTGSSLEVVYNEGVRRIVLHQGEALFQVARDSARPFQVHAGDRLVEAVGTAFSVQRTGATGVEVIVTEGKVLFQQREGVADAGAVRLEELALEAGQYVAAGVGSGELTRGNLDEAELEARLAWRDGMLLFQGESLEDVLRELARYTHLRIEADASVREIPVEGYFPVGDIEGLLVAIQENFHIDARRMDENHILLTAR